MNSKEEILKKIDLAITNACKPPISKSGIRENIYSLILEREQEAREKVIGELVEWMDEQREVLKRANAGINDKNTAGSIRQLNSCITHAKSLLKQEGIEKTYGEKLIDAIEKLEQMGLWEEWKEENPSRVNALKKLINS